jgi:hypothetical protein
VVGNTGDGALALFEGGPEGLSLTSIGSEPNLPDPTALSFSALTGGAVQFYAATAGRESADLVALGLATETGTGTGGGTGIGAGAGPGAGSSPSTAPAPSIGPQTGAAASSPTASTEGTATSVASASSAVSVQLVALHETSLPLAASVLTLTASNPAEETGPALAEAEAVGTVASAVGTGTSAGQGPFSTPRGGGATSGPTEDSDESGAGATAAPAVLAPWEQFVLGLDKALEELEREGAGGSTARSQPTDRPEPPPGPGAPAQGGGSGLRSVPERPSDDEWQGADRSRASDPERADDGWHAHVFVGMDGRAARIEAHAHEDVGMPPTLARAARPSGMEAIDAALARLWTDRARYDPGEIDPPTRRPGGDEHGLAPVYLAVSLLAAGCQELRARTRRIGLADRPSVPPIRHRPDVLNW